MLKDIIITKNEWILFKKNLIKKYNPIISVLKEIDEKDNKRNYSNKEKIKKLVFDSNPLKRSALEGAINYTKECWDDLFTFVNNGYVEISNNIAEQAVKPFVIQRKVFQISGSYAGARYTTKLFSIVQTCKINNINVERYFDCVLKNINNDQIENLLPYSSKIKNKID